MIVPGLHKAAEWLPAGRWTGKQN